MDIAWKKYNMYCAGEFIASILLIKVSLSTLSDPNSLDRYLQRLLYKINILLAIVWQCIIRSIEDFHPGSVTYPTSTLPRISKSDKGMRNTAKSISFKLIILMRRVRIEFDLPVWIWLIRFRLSYIKLPPWFLNIQFGEVEAVIAFYRVGVLRKTRSNYPHRLKRPVVVAYSRPISWKCIPTT